VRCRRAAPRHCAPARGPHRAHRCRLAGAAPMTDRETAPGNTQGMPGDPPQQLELRPSPAPITRINRKMLFGVVLIGLLFLSGLVIVALNPPRFASKAPS